MWRLHVCVCVGYREFYWVQQCSPQHHNGAAARVTIQRSTYFVCVYSSALELLCALAFSYECVLCVHVFCAFETAEGSNEKW